VRAKAVKQRIEQSNFMALRQELQFDQFGVGPCVLPLVPSVPESTSGFCRTQTQQDRIRSRGGKSKLQMRTQLPVHEARHTNTVLAAVLQTQASQTAVTARQSNLSLPHLVVNAALIDVQTRLDVVQSGAHGCNKQKKRGNARGEVKCGTEIRSASEYEQEAIR
jgi:hypothetical protein